MDTNALRVVALVARQGSFAAAARVLNIDPSSVSRTVAAAEEALGLRLFQRTTRALAPTEEGARYLARVTPLLDGLEQAREEALGLRATPSGTLRLTASVAFTHECILPHLAELTALHPALTIELLPTDANLDLLANDIDLAIRLASAPEGDLVCSRLLRTRYRVCASPDHVAAREPLESPEALADVDCLRFPLPGFRERWTFRREKDAPFDVPISGKLLILNALSLREAARAGLGPTLLADWLVGRDLAEGRLIDLFPDHECTATDFDTGAWALYPSRAFLPGKVRAIIDFLKARLPPLTG